MKIKIEVIQTLKLKDLKPGTIIKQNDGIHIIVDGNGFTNSGITGVPCISWQADYPKFCYLNGILSPNFTIVGYVNFEEDK